MMKDKIVSVLIEFRQKKSGSLGTVTFYRDAGCGSMYPHCCSITPRRVGRVLEAQRLFLAQLERERTK